MNTTTVRGKGMLPPLIRPPEVLPPCTDLDTFLMRLYGLSKDADRIEWPASDAIAIINAVALCDILKDKLLRRRIR